MDDREFDQKLLGYFGKKLKEHQVKVFGEQIDDEEYVWRYRFKGEQDNIVFRVYVEKTSYWSADTYKGWAIFGDNDVVVDYDGNDAKKLYELSEFQFNCQLAEGAIEAEHRAKGRRIKSTQLKEKIANTLF